MINFEISLSLSINCKITLFSIYFLSKSPFQLFCIVIVLLADQILNENFLLAFTTFTNILDLIFKDKLKTSFLIKDIYSANITLIMTNFCINQMTNKTKFTVSANCIIALTPCWPWSFFTEFSPDSLPLISITLSSNILGDQCLSSLSETIILVNSRSINHRYHNTLKMIIFLLMIQGLANRNIELRTCR